jgi:hypothetical protein
LSAAIGFLTEAELVVAYADAACACILVGVAVVDVVLVAAVESFKFAVAGTPLLWPA